MGTYERLMYYIDIARTEMSTWWEERSARVGRAAALVAAQANCSTSEALALLRQCAEEAGSDLEDTAVAVVGGRMSFAGDIRSSGSGPLAVCTGRE